MFKVVELWCELPHGDTWEKTVRKDLPKDRAQALADKLNETQALKEDQIKSYVVRPS